MDGFFDFIFGKKKKKKPAPKVPSMFPPTQAPTAVVGVDEGAPAPSPISKEVLGVAALFIGGAALFWLISKRKK